MEVCPFNEIDFTDEVCVDKIRVTVRSLAGSSFSASVGDGVTIGSLTAAVASKLDLDVREFRLVGDAAVPPADDTLIGALAKPEGPEGLVSLCLIKQARLDLHEARSLEEWREVAHALGDMALEDDAALEVLIAFLDKHPAMINLQESRVSDGAVTPNSAKPLLAYATEGVKSLSARQRCVDELLRRGARVSIRHAAGFLVDLAHTSGSAFAVLLESHCREYASYESQALKAWRGVSSRLCGETAQQVLDEAEMTRIVKEFCERHPEMVNFQSNHAVDELDVPYGYFGYAPLIAFAGAKSNPHRRTGHADDDEAVRRDSVLELLRHGARLDMNHGNRTAMEWMKVEGSLLLPLLEAQLNEPVQEQAAFAFSRA